MFLRGTVLLSIGQGLALISGYGINVFLARYLGPEGYGTFGIVFSILMMLEFFVVSGIPNALQRFVGENPDHSFSLHKFLFRWQLGYSFLFLIIAFLLSPYLAGLFKDDQISFLLRIAIFDIVIFGFYWYFNGFPIGQRRFARQTVIAATYSISKLVFVIAAVLLGFGIAGALVGNILGSLAGMILGITLLKIDRKETKVSHERIRQFVVSNIIYAVGLNLFFYVDLWFVKFYLSEQTVGFYNAAATLARVPYLFSIGLTGAILPSLSYAIAQDNLRDIERIIQQTIRILWMLILPAAVLAINASPQLISLFFGGEYHGAAEILKILFIGMSCLTLFAVMNTMVMAKTGMKGCSIIAMFLIGVDLIANMILVPRFQAQGAAMATTLTMVAGMIVSAAYLSRQFKIFPKIISLVRIAGVTAVIYFGTILFKTTGFWEMILKAVVLSAIYIVALRLIGEITTTDVNRIRVAFASVTGRIRTDEK